MCGASRAEHVLDVPPHTRTGQTNLSSTLHESPSSLHSSDLLIFHMRLHHNQSGTELCTVTETVIIRICRWTPASLEIRSIQVFQS